jgi:hypothetical protein
MFPRSFATTQHLALAAWPSEERGAEVEFRLVYSGPLPAAGRDTTRNKEKHLIRRVLSGQLKTLWETDPNLIGVTHHIEAAVRAGYTDTPTQSAYAPFTRCGRRFIPLVRSSRDRACALEILFLRRDYPGSVIQSGGDLDNRLKVLFDALRMPSHDSEVSGNPADDPDPFYCVMEDDRLIVDVRVTTDRLLLPTNAEEHRNDVHLVICVRTNLFLGGWN